MVRKTLTKTPGSVYQILFKESTDSCVQFVNFKDQIIPKVDCCIWLELETCPKELKRITLLRNYEHHVFMQNDSAELLKPFVGRPGWWLPQVLGDTIFQLHMPFNEDKSQTIFYGKDSSHIFICDKAI